jgi:glutathione S-transferase
MSAKTSAGESLPPIGGNTLSTGLFSLVFMGLAMGAGLLALHVDTEATLRAALPAGADPLALPMGACVLHVLVLQWLAMKVNAARLKYGVPWPFLYAERAHPHAVAYNCAQRAHQHVLEQSVSAALVLAVAGLEYPATAGAGIAVWSFSKVVGNVIGYSSGASSRKNWGAFGYLGLLPVTGLAVWATAKRLGLAPDEAMAASATHVAAGIAACRPYVESGARAAAPYATAAYEAASPYLVPAVDACRPYVTTAAEACRPYVTAAADMAAPYFSSFSAHA